MKKFFGSLLGGFIIGLLLAYWWIGYDSILYSQFNVAGEDEVMVCEMDFDFVFYATLLAAAAAAMYAIWSWIERKREEASYRDYRNRPK
ncbi:hypothetical protein QOZ98_000129 [Planomicrobium stackebrandtii]|uniref:Uncharacterized protein n=1 Tax=Planomicrobium stackebrandtii TaxID=253160 RepID=A0ABU0GPL8_9BACL|nr:hypothetical protein [Planomicrobium stackebrandtii]MDQ0427304.1 hypothetical protein [Planomicrobium stackebrandtii]